MKNTEEVGYFWVIGGGLLQIPLIEEVRKLGLSVLVSDGSSQCVCRQRADQFFEIDIFDVQAHLRKADELRSKGFLIRGVLAAGIDAVETMAELARHLGCVGVDPEVAHLVNKKHKFRRRLAELGHAVPRFETVGQAALENDQELNVLIERVGYPLIVKNSDSSGSRGTKIFNKPDFDGVKEMLKVAIAVSRSGVALLEECWQGPEQTVETLFDIEGRFHRCFITDRMFDKSTGFAIETGLRQPSALPTQTQDEMYDLAERVARDLGVRVGAAKFDMMLTKDGPRIIEMTVRLSGGFDCQYLVPAATGKQVMRAAIETALGRRFDPEILVDSKKRVGLTASIWPEPGKIVSITGVEEARKIDGFVEVFFRNKVGDTVSSYVDCTKRVCFVLATGANEQKAQAALERICSTIQIKTEKKKLLVYGAGAIGRGYVPWVYPTSIYDYYFVDRNATLIETLNKKREYTTYRVRSSGYEAQKVPVAGAFLLGQEISEIKKMDAVVTAVGPRNLLAISRNLFGTKMPIVCCENDACSAETVKSISQNPNCYFAIPDVITSNTAPEELLRVDPLAIVTEDGECFADVGAKELGGTCHYVDSEELAKQWVAKLYIHNTPHCIAAYLGSKIGATYIHEAMESDEVARIVERAMHEMQKMICTQFRVDSHFAQWYAEKELARFKNPRLFDPISRVAREPFRKLGHRDRLIGAASLCLASGIVPDALATGIMAAFHYESKSDPDINISYCVRALSPADFLRIIIRLRESEALFDLLVNDWGRHAEILNRLSENSK